MNDVINYLNKLDICDNDNIIVGVSGGPDSMCLLDLLRKYCINKNINIVCAHVNHKVRIESEKEAIDLKKYCNENSIIFEYMEILDYKKGNFESQARDKRYNFFEQLIKKYNSKYLFTAHHGDDLIETILMRIVRGSSIKGYSGISKESNRVGYKIIRPLLEFTKEDILNYVESNNMWYAIDKTNFEDVNTRNRYRKYILPQLKKENSLVHLKFNKFSNDLSECYNYIEKCSKKEYTNVIENNVLCIDKFLNLDIIIQKNIIYYMFESIFHNNLTLITSDHIYGVLDLLKDNNGNKYIDLPKKYKGIKEYNKFYIIKTNNVENYEYIIKDIVELPNNKKIELVKESNQTDNNIIYLNSNDIKLPLKVRTRNIGDKINVKNMQGTKKLNDIFIDCKISKKDRDLWPVVVDSNDTILWVPGLKKSKFDSKKAGKYDIILKYS